MNIETKFNLGDRVWVVTTGMIEKVVACTLCNDTKIINLRDTDYKCPRCSSGSGFIKYFYRNMIACSGRIGKVEVSQYAKERIAGREYADKREEKYMLDTTGIGSGNCWPVESLFASEKEAEDYCDAQNKVREEQEKV